jgi:hypothetical protein
MNLYLEIVNFGERAEQVADHLLRQRHDHKLHRVGVALRDLSLTVAQVLSDDVNKRLAELT